ncbi:Uncharacterized protein Rs2_46307 [Raphanus sativus]|nr:Uncharacterized protein Rs2_46307 [Raphanus sativus]
MLEVRMLFSSSGLVSIVMDEISMVLKLSDDCAKELKAEKVWGGQRARAWKKNGERSGKIRRIVGVGLRLPAVKQGGDGQAVKMRRVVPQCRGLYTCLCLFDARAASLNGLRWGVRPSLVL